MLVSARRAGYIQRVNSKPSATYVRPQKPVQEKRRQRPASAQHRPSLGALWSLHGYNNRPMFTIKAHDGAARVGVLATPSGSIETPAWLVYTRRGGALNLTPDMLAMLQPQGVQLDVLHLWVHRRHTGGGRRWAQCRRAHTGA